MTADRLDVGQRGAGPGEQRELDGQPVFRADEQVTAVGQVVHGRGHDALDRTFHRDDGPLGVPGPDGGQGRADRRVRYRLHIPRRLRADEARHRCLGKRPFRAEIGIAHSLIMP